MKIGNLEIRGDRCPWHPVDPNWANRHNPTKRVWGWNPWSDEGMGRFGGGWVFKLGLVVGRRSLLIEWGFGTIIVDWRGIKW